MREPRTSRVLWILGVAIPWALAWLLLGIRALLVLIHAPHPFLPDTKLTGAVLDGVIEWALTALVSYLVIGLLAGLLFQLSIADPTSRAMKANLTLAGGIWAGSGSLLFFHGVLYLLVPMALASLPWLKWLPMGLNIALFMGLGAWLLLRTIRRTQASKPLLRWVACLSATGFLTLVPHDVFRRLVPAPKALPPGTPRMFIVGLDGVRQDMFEEAMPAWKAPNGVQPATIAPSTRRAWNLLLGGDPLKVSSMLVMPFEHEIRNPLSLQIVDQAEKAGLRTAFAINDSLTPAFGLQANHFTTVAEPVGGWKYWFTLGYGTVWPAYSWSQNYFSPIETSNPWSSVESYWGDLERLIANHNMVFSHECSLHDPIILRLPEIQLFRPWRWIVESAGSYKPYRTEPDAVQDDFRRGPPKADPLGQYGARLKYIIRTLEPRLQRWTNRFPSLSGVVTSDHGEQHIPIRNRQGKPGGHLSGIHGFVLEPLSTWVPLHPFGATTHSFDPGQLYTWLELRDDVSAWIQSQAPLRLNGSAEALLYQYPTIMAAQRAKESSAQVQEDQGIRPEEFVQGVMLTRVGTWFLAGSEVARFKNRKLSYAILDGDRLLAFNPGAGGKYDRLEYKKYEALNHRIVDFEAVEQELKGFKGRRPMAEAQP